MVAGLPVPGALAMLVIIALTDTIVRVVPVAGGRPWTRSSCSDHSLLSLDSMVCPGSQSSSVGGMITC